MWDLHTTGHQLEEERSLLEVEEEELLLWEKEDISQEEQQLWSEEDTQVVIWQVHRIYSPWDLSITTDVETTVTITMRVLLGEKEPAMFILTATGTVTC